MQIKNLNIGCKMINRDLHLFMIKHGAIVTLLGSLSELGYTIVISGDIPGTMRSWHLAHLQGVLTGILIIAASSYINHSYVIG